MDPFCADRCQGGERLPLLHFPGGNAGRIIHEGEEDNVGIASQYLFVANKAALLLSGNINAVAKPDIVVGKAAGG